MQCVWSAMPGLLGTQPHDKMACLKPHPSPIPDPNLAKKNQQLNQQQQQHQFKRKRSDSFDPTPQKRQKAVDGASQSAAKPHQTLLKFTTPSTVTKAAVAPSTVQPAQAAAGAASTDTIPQQVAPAPEIQPDVKPCIDPQAESAARTRAHDRIEANLNLQILLKHDELRLIEQELGKCQIALEQLRRCKVIPYPGQPGSEAPMDDILSGTGPALHPQAGLSRPSHPSPFGVTDGPYSRHYAQWLIPDSAFDPSLPRQPRITAGIHSLQGRPLRGSFDMPLSATTPRAGRASLSGQHASLPSNFSIPRDRHAPLTVPRPSDGQLVKIVCKVCGKKDSANVQGFTNHCRIAHGINYASHSEAIIDCGQPVGSDEVPVQVAPTPTPVEPKVMSSVSSTPQTSGKPSVHPLITAPTAEQNRKRSIFANATAPATVRTTSSEPSHSSDQAPHVAAMASKEQLVPSTESPHLSALLNKRGVKLNLKSLITASKEKIDLNEVSPLLSDDDDDSPATDGQNSTASTPLHGSVKPKNRRANVGLSGVRVPGRTQGGTSRLKINTSSAAVTGIEPRTADSSQPSTVNTPSAAVPNREANRNLGTGGMRIKFDPLSSVVDSPMELDTPETPEDSSDVSASTNLSPHTIDTNPGLVTDNEDDVDYGDSEQEEEHERLRAAEGQSREVDVGVTVREDDSHHTDEMMRQLEDASDGKPEALPSLPSAVVQRTPNVASNGTTTPRKRGRPRKNP